MSGSLLLSLSLTHTHTHTHTPSPEAILALWPWLTSNPRLTLPSTEDIDQNKKQDTDSGVGSDNGDKRLSATEVGRPCVCVFVHSLMCACFYAAVMWYFALIYRYEVNIFHFFLPFIKTRSLTERLTQHGTKTDSIDMQLNTQKSCHYRNFISSQEKQLFIVQKSSYIAAHCVSVSFICPFFYFFLQFLLAKTWSRSDTMSALLKIQIWFEAYRVILKVC